MTLLFILTLLGSFVTSFAGSFLCFVIWVHFDFDAKWEQHKYGKHAAALAKTEEAKRIAKLALEQTINNDLQITD